MEFILIENNQLIDVDSLKNRSLFRENWRSDYKNRSRVISFRKSVLREKNEQIEYCF